MGRSEKFLGEVSDAAQTKNTSTFSKLKDMFSKNKEEEEKKKQELARKELIERERQKTMESLKNKY